MGVLHLCSHELAFVPYYIENIGLNVYSLEELCHYLKHNIDLVEPSFMDDELIGWIREELKLSLLADELCRLKMEGGSLPEFIEMLAKGCSYCTPEEIRKMKEAVADFKNKSEIECRKIRADRLLMKKRYGASIMEYFKLLQSGEVSGVFAGNIYHNLGTAYAGLFFFQEAADCYGKAFVRNKDSLSLKQQQEAIRLAEGKETKAERAESTGSFPEGTLEIWKNAYIKSCK